MPGEKVLQLGLERQRGFIAFVDADGVSNLRASIERVLRHRRPDTMPVLYTYPRTSLHGACALPVRLRLGPRKRS